MGELQFAKQFLTSLDSKSTKYQSDHVFDPKDFQTRIPYTLPRLSHPPHPLPPNSRTPSTPPPGSTIAVPTITVTLKSTRNPALTLTLPDLNPSSTSIQSLKESVQSALGGPSIVGVEKIKILLNKKPIPASKKTVADTLEGVGLDGKEKQVELGVMVMGGAPDPPPQPQPQAAPPPSQQPSGPDSENTAVEAAAVPDTSTPMEGILNTTSTPAVNPVEISGKAVLETPDFWDDLQGFLSQRIKDESQARRVHDVFQAAWKVAG
jgi:ubiquitin-like protein 4